MRLPVAAGTEDIIGEKTWVPLANREKLSLLRVIAICGAMLSYQVSLSVEFTLGTPILMRFGTSQVYLALVWSAVPITGFVIQPLVGYYSDRTLSRLGRRRPFIIGGGLGILVGLLILYYVENIGNMFGREFSKTASIVIFSVDLVWTNCFINILQGPARAILGDVVPKGQQVTANTIASLMMSVAACVTSLTGGVRLMPGNYLVSSEQLVIICGSILILAGLAMTVFAAKEEPIYEAPPRANPFRRVIQASLRMPTPVFRVAIIYFFSWISYFPFQISVTDFFGTDIYHGSSDFESGERRKYDDGVSFGMLVLALANLLVIFYTPCQPALVRTLGMRLVYAISQLVAAVSMILVLFVKNKWALMGIMTPLGIAFAIFNSIPFAICGMIVGSEQMGTFMSVLNCFAFFGQQLSLSLVGAGKGFFLRATAPIIGAGSGFSIIAAILCSCLIIPQTEEENIQDILASGPFKSRSKL